MPARPVPDRLRVASGMAERSKNLSIGIGRPDPPKHLSRRAKAEWRRVVRVCADQGTWLQHADIPIIEAWCTWRAVQIDATEALAADGVLIPGRSPSDQARRAMVKHPAVTLLRQATAELQALSARLGFDPDSRARIAIGDFDPTDDDADFDAPRRVVAID